MYLIQMAFPGLLVAHDDVIKCKHFPRYWPFVRGIHRSMVNSPHKGHGRGALMFSLICARTNGWVDNREAGDLRRHRSHYDVAVIRVHKHSLCQQTHYRLSNLPPLLPTIAPTAVHSPSINDDQDMIGNPWSPANYSNLYSVTNQPS